jgi:hypothetical protein
VADGLLTNRPRPIHPLLLAAYWVLALYAANLAEASLGQVIPVLVGALALTGAAWLVLSLVLRNVQRAAILAFAGTAVFYGYSYLIDATGGTSLGGWPLRIAVVLFVGASFLAALAPRSPLPAITRGLNILTALLVAVTLITIVPAEVTKALTAEAPPSGVKATVPFTANLPANALKRDIYFIVPDRYGSQRALALDYGIEDNAFPDWLEQHGFYVARGSHANYVRTSWSLIATLNLAYLEDVPSGNGISVHAVGQFLKDLGYRYIHIGANIATQTSAIADVNVGLDTTSEFARSLLDTTLYSKIAVRLGVEHLNSARQRQVDWTSFELQSIADAEAVPGPKFVFVHVLLPHPPYVYDSDGRVISDREDAGRSDADGYHDQLLYTNTRLEQLFEPLLARPPDEQPIIVIAADEGPYPKRYDAVRREGQGFDWDWAQATGDEIETKFGILDALYLPGVDRSELYPSISPVNTFRLIFSRYFGVQLPLLPDRSFAPSPSHGGTIEITDQLQTGG